MKPTNPKAKFFLAFGAVLIIIAAGGAYYFLGRKSVQPISQPVTSGSMLHVSYSIPSNWKVRNIKTADSSTPQNWYDSQNAIIFESPTSYYPKINCVGCGPNPTPEASVEIATYPTNNYSSAKEWYAGLLSGHHELDTSGTVYSDINLNGQSAYFVDYSAGMEPGHINEAYFVLWKGEIYQIRILAIKNTQSYAQAKKMTGTVMFK